MKITKVETVRVQEFDQAFWVEVHTDTGLVGLGETYYAPRALAAIVHDVFAPRLIGQDPLAIDRHWHNMFRQADAWGYGGAEARAISALDIALWDIAGQATGQPIYNLLGGACRDKIRVYETYSGDRLANDPVGLAKELLAEGITAVKVYPFAHTDLSAHGQHISPQDIERGLEPIKKIREALGNAIEIAHDGGARWDLVDAIRIAQAMEPYDILWQEELLSTMDVDAHVKLARETKTPICSSERLLTRFRFHEYLEKGAVEIVMPDLVWTGGISETKKISTMAEAYQLPVAPHDCTGPVNEVACAHICMNVPNIMIMESTRSYYKGWYGKIIEPNVRIENGFLFAPEGPGLGVRLRRDVKERPDATVAVTDRPGPGPVWSLYPFAPSKPLTPKII
ncbi:MAG: mandelate racemase/muconate lactonizing enzyme family protein [Chloroflexota bacterium]|nr:mandelate racemase/muconate lactonizing enzyme family protein [Chloroflexota bacterium]